MDAPPDNSISKAVSLLHALRASDRGGSARELAASTGLARSTVQRILTTLAGTGMVVQDQDDQRYRIGPQALLIGLGYRQGMTIVNLARPFMLAIRDQTSETVGLSVAVGDARVFIEEVPSTSELRFASELGKLYPLWSGASGRILLSGLPAAEVEEILNSSRLAENVHRVLPLEEISREVEHARTQGYAVASRETIAEVSSVAVPILDADQSVVAALSVSGPEARLTRDKMDQVLPVLRQAADALSERLGGRSARRVPPRA